MFVDEEYEQVVWEAEERKGNAGDLYEERPKVYSTIPGHLASPIYEGECKMLITAGEKVFSCKRHRMLKEFVARNNVVSLLSTVEIDPLGFLSTWIDNNVFWKGRMRVEDLCDYATNWEIHRNNSFEPAIRGGLLDRDEIREDVIQRLGLIRTKFKGISSQFVEMKKVEVLKDTVCFKEIELGFLKYFGSILCAERDVTFLQHQSGWVILPTTMFLCAMDKKQSIFPLFAYWIISDTLEKYQNVSLFDRGYELFYKFIELRKKMQQDFFTLASTWESMTVGHVVILPDDIGCSKLYNSQRQEFKELLAKYNISEDPKSFLPRSIHIEEICLHLELTGMHKVFGFPTLEEEHLLDQLREHGVGQKHQFNYTTMANIMGLARRDFLLNYFKKKGRYPRLKSCPDKIRHYVSKNKPIPATLNNDYKEWNEVIFDKNFNYDYAPDQLELLKDSACAINLSAWGRKYDRCAFKYHYGKSPPPSSKETPLYPMRTITAFLKGHADAVRKGINFCERGIYPEEDHIAIQNGKECEMKIKTGRSFTTQTPMRRLIQTSMEMNTSKSIFPFVPEQSMTDSEILCHRRILEQVESMEGDSEVVVLDLKKWCLFQRHIPNSKLGIMYDELFGLSGVYQHSHAFFIDCNIFNNSRNHPPDYDSNGNPIPGPFYMNDYDGAFEGLSQKPWTHYSSATVKYVGEICDVDARVMCQGDNQIIILSYRKGQDREEVRANFLSTLSLTFNEIGHELKAKETWYSKHLHEYGKMRVYKGCFISQGTKKASRCIPDINDGLFSIPSSISTINTITESIARGDQHPDAAFILNQMMVGNYLVRKGLCQHNEVNKMRTLLLFPVDFGGIPLSTLNSHTLRGHDDKITLWCSIIKTCQTVDPSLFNKVMEVWSTSPSSPASSAKARSRLYEDIFCLNNPSLPSPTREIKEATLEFLRSDYVTNPVVKKLYDATYAHSKEQLVETLDTMKVKFIPLAHELISLSNAGILETMQKKITSTKTMEQIIRSHRDVSLIELYEEFNHNYKLELRARFSRGSMASDYDMIKETDCPTQIARLLREKSWGPGLVGITKPIYQHQVTLKSMDAASIDELNRCITIQVSNQFVESPQTFAQVFGPFQPYIASTTKEKVKRKTVDIVEKTSHVLSLLDLLKLKSWMNILGHSNLMKFIDGLIAEKLEVVTLPEDIDDITDIGSTITSGNIFHRFLSDMESNFAIVNCCTGVTTHFKQSSNSMKSMTAGGKDYQIFYQMILVADMTLLISYNKLCQRPEFQYVSILSCPCCSELIEDIDFDLSCSPGMLLKVDNLPIKTRIDPIIQIPNIRAVMSMDVGRRFAVSVDAEYENSHVRGCGGVKLTSARREVISMNDLRQIDLRLVFHTCIVYSSHCRDILRQSGNPIMESLSYSRAFIPLAEALFNSGLIHKFVKLINYPATEHTMLTRTDGLSALISRAIPSYARKNWETIVEDAFRYYFREDYDSAPMKRVIREIITLKIKLDPNFTEVEERKATRILKHQTCGRALNFLKIRRSVVSIPRDQVLLSWRSSDRPNTLDLKVQPPNPLLRMAPQDYPFAMVTNYYFERHAEENTGVLDIPELSFLSRPLGTISSAASKYIEILEVFEITTSERYTKKTIYTLAEGSCGSGATLLKVFPAASLWYNSLMTPETDPRYDITDHTPPGLINSCQGTSERVLDIHRLAHGETDILTDAFYEKLETAFTECPPVIITMDAESPNRGTNLEFVYHLLPLICKFKPKIAIFKMFFLCDFTKQLEDLIPEDIWWCLFKPISSNPCGFEIFLVMLPRCNDQLPPIKIQSIIANQFMTTSYLSKSVKMTIEMVERYYKVSVLVASSLETLYETAAHERHHLLFSRYDRAIEEGQICSMHCKKHMYYLGEAIERTHSTSGMVNVHLIVRRPGTEESCARLVNDFVYLVVYYTCHRDLVSTLLRLSTIQMTEDFETFRKGQQSLFALTHVGEGNFTHQWGDMKMYMRDQPRSPHCSCDMPTYEWEADKSSPSLVRRVLNFLIDADMATKKYLDWDPTW